jgi:hypothetical protein
MKLVIELSDTEAERLRSEAARLEVDSSELVRAMVCDFLSADEEVEVRKRWMEDVRARKERAPVRILASEIVRHRDADRR